MPNIEIRGFLYQEAENLREKIDMAMEKIGLAGEAITSIEMSETKSCDTRNTPQPFLRICSTDKEDIQKIIVALRTAGVCKDVESLILDGFVSKNQMLAQQLATEGE